MSESPTRPPRETLTATVAQLENISFHRTPVWVVWLADIHTSTGILPGRSCLHITKPVAVLDLQPGDQVQCAAQVLPNQTPAPQGIFAEWMQARRTAYWLKRPGQLTVLNRAGVPGASHSGGLQ